MLSIAITIIGTFVRCQSEIRIYTSLGCPGPAHDRGVVPLQDGESPNGALYLVGRPKRRTVLWDALEVKLLLEWNDECLHV